MAKGQIRSNREKKKPKAEKAAKAPAGTPGFQPGKTMQSANPKKK